MEGLEIEDLPAPKPLMLLRKEEFNCLGTILEWGNHWARGIHYRNQDNCAAAGFFSQVGQLYNVNHLWAYKDLQVT
jgi:hypothetical protein